MKSFFVGFGLVMIGFGISARSYQSIPDIVAASVKGAGCGYASHDVKDTCNKNSSGAWECGPELAIYNGSGEGDQVPKDAGPCGDGCTNNYQEFGDCNDN